MSEQLRDQVQRLRVELAYTEDLARCRGEENERLRALLREANNAFDECTGDYPKELVDEEPWRAFRSVLDETERED